MLSSPGVEKSIWSELRAKSATILPRVLALILICQTAFSSFLADSAFAGTAELSLEEEQVERLTNDILHKEIDLERYYLLYRNIAMAEPKFRRMRYFALQVASGSCAMAANIIFTKVSRQSLKAPGVTNFGRGDSDPDAAEDDDEIDSDHEAEEAAAQKKASSNNNKSASNSKSLPSSSSSTLVVNEDENQGSNSASNTIHEIREATILNILATVLDGGSSIIEMGSNTFTAIKNIRKGQSPAAAVKTVRARIAEIDAMMAARNRLINEHPELRAISINKAETLVLKCFRDWCLSEFVDIYAEVKSNQSGANVYYILDIASDGCYLASNILGLKSLTPGKEKFIAPSLHSSIVGDAIAIISAPGSAVAGNWLYKYWHKRLKKKLKEDLRNGEDEAKSAMKQLKDVVVNTDKDALVAAAAIEARVTAYVLWAQRYDKVLEKQLQELKHQAKVAHQSEFVGPVISGTSLAQDILAEIALYRFPTNERAGASLAYAGSITGLSGNAASLGFTNANLVGELLHRRKLRKNNNLPEQMMSERLNVLNQLDKMVSLKKKLPLGL